MIITNGLAILEMPISASNLMYPVLIWDEQDAVLFDACLPGQATALRTAVREAGVSFQHLLTVILTHQDLDHIGSTEGLRQLSDGRIRVMAHATEIPFIQFDEKPTKMKADFVLQFAAQHHAELRPDQVERIKQDLAGAWPEVRPLFADVKARVDTALQDREVLPLCGGIEVIHTPGHTPGHCCFYLRRYKALVAGDALNVQNGGLVGPSTEHSANLRQAVQSLRLLEAYDIDTVLCYHGGLFAERANARIAALASQQA
jgi:glyoxylase-like metal-dependent hydrolase (beta-lactamase superfamily II)